MEENTQKVLICGIGNPFFGDQGIGIDLALYLRDKYPDHPNVDIVEIRQDHLKILEVWQDYGHVIILTFTRTDAEGGTLSEFDVTEGTLPDFFEEQNHSGVGLKKTLNLANAMRTMPKFCKVFGVEGHDFRKRIEISEEAQTNYLELIKKIDAIISEVEKLNSASNTPAEENEDSEGSSSSEAESNS